MSGQFRVLQILFFVFFFCYFLSMVFKESWITGIGKVMIRWSGTAQAWLGSVRLHLGRRAGWAHLFSGRFETLLECLGNESDYSSCMHEVAWCIIPQFLVSSDGRDATHT